MMYNMSSLEYFSVCLYYPCKVLLWSSVWLQWWRQSLVLGVQVTIRVKYMLVCTGKQRFPREIGQSEDGIVQCIRLFTPVSLWRNITPHGLIPIGRVSRSHLHLHRSSHQYLFTEFRPNFNLFSRHILMDIINNPLPPHLYPPLPPPTPPPTTHGHQFFLEIEMKTKRCRWEMSFEVVGFSCQGVYVAVDFLWDCWVGCNRIGWSDNWILVSTAGDRQQPVKTQPVISL